MKIYTPKLIIPPMFENVVTVWWIAGGMLPGLIDTQIPNIAIAHHWKMKASTNIDIARTAACLILLADDCFPSEVFSFFSMERSFAHVSTYSVVFTTKITDRGRVVKRNCRNWPFTPSKKHLKQMQIDFLETCTKRFFKCAFLCISYFPVMQLLEIWKRIVRKKVLTQNRWVQAGWLPEQSQITEKGVRKSRGVDASLVARTPAVC